MSGFFGTDGADLVATWVAALATLIVLGGLLGERRLFTWAQHLLAGLATGYLALVVISEVLVPRLVQPLVAGPGRGELWLGVALVGAAAGAPWLPRMVAAVPVSIAIGSLAAFALGGAVVGTLLPQLVATIGPADGTAVEVATLIGSAVITSVVLLGFLRGTQRGRLLAATAGTGRWLLVAGLGGWLGYLLLSRLVLLLDRIAFLLGDWLGLAP
jgi:hypothetical protein